MVTKRGMGSHAVLHDAVGLEHVAFDHRKFFGVSQPEEQSSYCGSHSGYQVEVCQLAGNPQSKDSPERDRELIRQNAASDFDAG